MEEHVHDIIRRLAKRLTGAANINDFQIIYVARSQGCEIPVADDLRKLTFIHNFLLGKHMVKQAEAAGISKEEIAGQPVRVRR